MSMSAVVVNADLRGQLLATGGVVEVRDEDGAVIGTFCPSLYELYELDPPDITDEELERRFQPGRKRYTTDEVLAHLRKLA
jgi:hypothetical protein